MDLSAIIVKFLSLPRNKRKAVVGKAIDEYATLLTDISQDIYESCIKVYYSSYIPKIYQRHGDIGGFNLYVGFYSNVNNVRIDADYSPERLIGYDGISREEVLGNVVTGQRGSKTRKGGWPRSWSAQYPNAYSNFSIWSSGGDTIDSILTDFYNTAVEKTSYIFWENISKYI